MSAAERQREYRSRRRKGRMVVPVMIDDVADPEYLVDAGFLAAGKEENRPAIGEAIARFLRVARNAKGF